VVSFHSVPENCAIFSLSCCCCFDPPTQMYSMKHSVTLRLQYSGKNWWALNLAISSIMLYFQILLVFDIVIWSLCQKLRNHNDISLMVVCHLKLREVSSSLGWGVLSGTPSHLHPLLWCVCVVLHLMALM